ncbi:Cytochrome p450 [Thalictrum thalictroides]|uniref:Cytochrome p450 n=1 Tax=Thalictrum thalictroides TaxID=46969 RepID=A0A7J6WWX7_THATH|nr:Cytochrome p450 [Thalictrum thalictroides]
MNMLGSFTATDFFPYFGWIIDVFTGHSRRLEKCFHAFDNFYQQVIDEHLDPQRIKPEQEDIIDVLIRLQNEQSGAVSLTVSHIKAILMNIFLGGVDTAAITMVWGMTELALNPEVMKKTQEEIRSYVGNKGKVEESDIDKLEYFKMVVKETLRMHPPSIFLIPRETMNHCKVNGYDIYPKTRALVNVWAIARNGEYWENSDEFTPESNFTRNSCFLLLTMASGHDDVLGAINVRLNGEKFSDEYGYVSGVKTVPKELN